MTPASDRLRAALTESHRVICRAEITAPGLPAVWADVVDGQVTADRTRPIRYSVDLTLAPGTSLPAVSPYRSRIRVWRGVQFGTDDVEMVPVGTFRVQDVDSSLPADRVAVTGLGLESYVRDDRFFTVGYLPPGSAVQGLRRFITESVPGGVEVDVRVPDTFVAPASWDEARWDGEEAACQMLARSLGAEVFADALGRFVVRRTPGMSDVTAGATVGGPGGVLVGATQSATREGVYNCVVARSSRTDGGDVAELSAVVWDADPYSPTYLGPDAYAQPVGAFGRSVQRYSSPLLATYSDCERAAASVLADSRGLVVQTGVTQLADPTIEPGDIRLVQTPAGQERQLIDALSLPLGPGDMSLTCRSMRVGG